MATVRKKYMSHVLNLAVAGDLPVSTPPSASAAESAPPATEPKPVEPPVETDPVREAEQSAIKQRLREMENAEALARQAPQQPPSTEEPQELTAEKIIASSGLPDLAKNWLRQYPEFVLDPIKNAKLQKMHPVAEYQAGSEFSEKYFDRMEVLLGLKPEAQPVSNGQAERPAPPPPPRAAAPPRQQAPYVSAPPTREVPSMSTGRPANSRITLTAEETEFAKSCKQTPHESDEVSIRRYAQNKLKALQDGIIGPGARDGR